MRSQIFNGLEKPLIWLSRSTTYLVYLVPLQLWRFHKTYPNTKIIVSGVTKARKMEAQSPVQYELGWVTSRRSLLVLTDTHLICGDWIMSLNQISDTILLNLTGGYVLKVSTLSGEYYQFSLNKNSDWKTQSVLPLTNQKGSIEYSNQSLILRAIGIASLCWYLYQAISAAELVNTILAIIGIALIGIPLLLRVLEKLRQKGEIR